MPEVINHPASSPASSPNKLGQKKILIIIGAVIVALVVILIGLMMFGQRNVVENVVPAALQPDGGVSEITLETEYANPFDREAQYVNPFEEFKSPFQSLQ